MAIPLMRTIALTLTCLVAFWGGGPPLRGDDAAPTPAAAPDQPPLGDRQKALQRDYERFEKMLNETGNHIARSDPERADLLFRTRGQSQQLRVLEQIRLVAEMLEENQSLGDAVARQDEVIQNLESLLKLLQSENERDRLTREIQRIEDLLKDTNRVIARQKDVRADTERGRDAGVLEGAEQKVADEAQRLAAKIDEQDAQRAADAQSQGAESPSGQSPDGETKPGEPTEETPGAGEKPEGEKPTEKPGKSPPNEPRDDDAEKPKPGEGPSKPQDPADKPGASKPPEESGQPASPSSPQETPPGESPMPSDGAAPGQPPSQPQQPQPLGQPQSQSPGQSPMGQSPMGDTSSEPQQTPGREELEQARAEMERAIQELRKQNKEGASKEQDDAIAKLEAMKAQLEEILRQLREEEKEIFLALLEARFQKMLRRQKEVNAETERLDKTPAPERTSRHLAKATQISREQQENALEADKALQLLREEGSSVAFPEAVEQMRDNMRTVSDRLGRADTGETTRLIEQIIIETLDEMILALQQEMEKSEKEQQQQKQQQGEPQDPALVDTLAELKMVRSLQNQVNRMTKQIGLQIEGEEAADPESRRLLEELSGRQQRIHEATYDLATGKNK